MYSCPFGQRQWQSRTHGELVELAVFDGLLQGLAGLLLLHHPPAVVLERERGTRGGGAPKRRWLCSTVNHVTQ